MTDEITMTILGCGNAQATKNYNTCLLLSNRGENLLVDGGGGNTILSILEKKNIALSSIQSLFITHAHTDHLLGCIWIIRRIGEEINKGKYTPPFIVYADGHVIEILTSFLKEVLTKKIYSLFGEKIIFVPLSDRESFPILGGVLTPFDIKSTKLKQFGFVFEKDGVKLVDCGDEGLDESNYSLAIDADYMTHEAFCLYSDRETFHPYEKSHNTVMDTAKKAEELGVRNLIIYHTEDVTDISTRRERYKEEAQKYYSGNVFVPDDGDVIILKKER